MSTETIDFDDVSFVNRSTYRVAVMDDLADGGPATPSIMADRTDIDITHISRALSSLSGEGFVELLVDESVRKGRYYGLTEKGREIQKQARSVR